MIQSGSLPEGACWRALRPASDARGVFTEIYRTEWIHGTPALQWNFTRSEAGVMRGVRVHPRHDDYLVVLDGSLQVGLRDLRRRSPSFGRTVLVRLDGSSPSLLGIPAGVAHGLYATERCLFVIGASRYYDPDDEIACRWDDPELGIPWTFSQATVSPTDGSAPSVAEITELLDRTM
jgi:dTDP-4-dehydrorhamnose 3,5-epimerase-like enzyme